MSMVVGRPRNAMRKEVEKGDKVNRLLVLQNFTIARKCGNIL